jgi:phosphoesterase RecJ-like protein
MDFSESLTIIRNAKNILLTSHVRPDGDALGSIRGLYELILQLATKENRQCTVQTLALSKPPETIDHLLPDDGWVFDNAINHTEIDQDKLNTFDLAIVVDTSASKQLPGVGQAVQTIPNLLIIDHHLSGDIAGTHKVVDTNCSACCEMIFALYEQSNEMVNTIAAEAMFIGIATDTGWLRFENVTAKTLRILGKLAEAGAQPDRIHDHLYQNDPPERLQLVACALNSVTYHADGKLAIQKITNDTLAKTKAHRSLIEGIVNLPMSVDSIICSILLVEQTDNTVRCSLRSKQDIDMNKIANQFNGGGHARASGATIHDSIDVAQTLIVQAVTAAIKAI